MIKLPFFVLFGVFCCPLWAKYQGLVYQDSNANGQYDQGESLQANVLVSDGLHVVKTDSKGRFQLAGHAKEKFIFITTPSGFKTYNAYYQAIEAGKEQYQFALYPSAGVAEDGSHQFIQITDTEIREEQGHQSWIEGIKEYSSQQQSAFIFHTGDICYTEGLKAHIKIMNSKNMDCPVYYTIGNHDLVSGKTGEALYESLYGPVYYSFDVGKVHYIVVPMLSGDYAPSYSKEDVYNWLINDLAQIEEGTPIYIFSHDRGGSTPDALTYNINAEKTLELEKHNIKAWVYGHWHVNHISKHGKAYCISTSVPMNGGIDHSTASYRVMHIDGKGDFRSELRYLNVDSVTISSINRNQSPVTGEGIVPLMVNAYNSNSPVQSINYQIKVNDSITSQKGKLSQQSDWAWSGAIDTKGYQEGDNITVQLLLNYQNGEVVKKEKSFILNRKTAEVKLQGDWTNLLGNAAHRGVVQATLSACPQLKWVNNIGSNIYMTSPIIYQGKVYTASMDENNQSKSSVAAYDAHTGKLLWKYPTQHSVKNTIVAESGYIFAQDALGILYALEADSGKLAWQKQLKVDYTPGLNEGLATQDGVVYAGVGQGLVAVEASSGKILWQNKDWSQGYSATSTISLGGNVLVLGTQWGALYANDSKTGKKLWQLSDGELRHRASSPSFYDNKLYTISYNSLYIIDPKAGKVIQKKSLPYSLDVTSTPLLTDTHIIFGTATEGLVALDKNTLEEKWKYRTDEALIITAPYVRRPAAMIESSPVLVNNTVFIGGLDGTLHALDSRSGKLQWKAALGAPIFSSLAVSGNSIYICDFAGNIYCFVSE